MTLSAVVVTLIVGTFVPLLVGLVTKIDASSKLKGAIMLVINAAQGLIVAATTATGEAVITVDALILFLTGVAMSLLTYYGLYKPNDVASKLAPEFGVGKTSETSTD